jgi:hypothetical protein
MITIADVPVHRDEVPSLIHSHNQLSEKGLRYKSIYTILVRHLSPTLVTSPAWHFPRGPGRRRVGAGGTYRARAEISGKGQLVMPQRRYEVLLLWRGAIHGVAVGPSRWKGRHCQ